MNPMGKKGIVESSRSLMFLNLLLVAELHFTCRINQLQ